MGGFLFGIVFMATDPASAAASNRGKIIWFFNRRINRDNTCSKPLILKESC